MGRLNGEVLRPHGQLLETLITLEVKYAQKSLGKDIIETVTGLSSSAISAGGKIAAETVVYSGESTPSQVTAGIVFSSLSLAANVVDFVAIPLGYLYKLYSKEPIPFNLSNNTKWFFAGVNLMLSILSFAVVVIARTISFISVGFSLLAAAVSFAKYFYDQHRLTNKIKSKDEKIDALCVSIRNDMELINRYQDNLRFVAAQPALVESERNLLLHALDELYDIYESHCERVRQAYKNKLALEHSLRRHSSILDLVSYSLRILFACAVLVGTILALNPVTLPIGMPIIAAAALLGLVAFIVKKVVEVVQKRQTSHENPSRDAIINIEINSTTTIIKSCRAAPLTRIPSHSDIVEIDDEPKKSKHHHRESSVPFLSDDDADDEDEALLKKISAVSAR